MSPASCSRSRSSSEREQEAALVLQLGQPVGVGRRRAHGVEPAVVGPLARRAARRSTSARSALVGRRRRRRRAASAGRPARARPTATHEDRHRAAPTRRRRCRLARGTSSTLVPEAGRRCRRGSGRRSARRGPGGRSRRGCSGPTLLRLSNTLSPGQTGHLIVLAMASMRSSGVLAPPAARRAPIDQRGRRDQAEHDPGHRRAGPTAPQPLTAPPACSCSSSASGPRP